MVLRTSADEYLYGHELEQYKLWGIVSELRLAFSRDPGVKKTYVQDLIQKDGDLFNEKNLLVVVFDNVHNGRSNAYWIRN